jgi:hypothetical protein
MTVSGLKRKWEEVRLASNLKWFRLYDTRHTGITRLAEQGIPIQVIMSRAGHISPRMSQHYTHVSEAAQRRWLQPSGNPQPYMVPNPPQRRFDYQQANFKTIYINGKPIEVPA